MAKAASWQWRSVEQGGNGAAKKQDGSKIKTSLSFSTSFHEEVSGKGVRNLIVNSTYFAENNLKEHFFF